jgi:hypothetical protein
VSVLSCWLVLVDFLLVLFVLGGDRWGPIGALLSRRVLS